MHVFGRRIALPLLLLLASAACGGDSVTAPTSYDLLVDLRWFRVIGDCEATPGNPGEFTWRVTISRALAGSDIYETTNFPNESGAQSYSDGANAMLGGIPLTLTNVDPAYTGDISLIFSVVEHDPSGYDPGMNFLQQLDILPFPADELFQTATVGASSACRVALDYTVTWTAS